MDIFKFLKDNYFTFSSFKDFLIFVVPLVVTWTVTKYTANNPRKKEINKQQFLNVYLPLYKLFCSRNKKVLTLKEARHYSVRLHNILQNNYELAFPQLHALSKDLIVAVENKDGYNPVVKKISYQVSVDYEILKKKLGYPHLSLWQLFKRLTFIDKIREIVGWSIIFYTFPGIFIVASLTITLRNMFLYFIGLIVLCYIGLKLGDSEN